MTERRLGLTCLHFENLRRLKLQAEEEEEEKEEEEYEEWHEEWGERVNMDSESNLPWSLCPSRGDRESAL